MVRDSDLPVSDRLGGKATTRNVLGHLWLSMSQERIHLSPTKAYAAPKRASHLDQTVMHQSCAGSVAQGASGHNENRSAMLTQSRLHPAPIGSKYQTLIRVCSRVSVDNSCFGSQLCVNRWFGYSQLCASALPRSVNNRGQCSQLCVGIFRRHQLCASELMSCPAKRSEGRF